MVILDFFAVFTTGELMFPKFVLCVRIVIQIPLPPPPQKIPQIIFHLSPVTCHLSPVTCRMSPVTCHLSIIHAATGTDPPGNSPTMHSSMVCKEPKKLLKKTQKILSFKIPNLTICPLTRDL